LISERVISTALGALNRRRLELKPCSIDALPQPQTGRGYVLYVHVPFCEHLCARCSRNRFVQREDRAREYFRRLREEMYLVADLGYDFVSLDIGGGTSEILLPELTQTIQVARRLFPGIRRVSVEASPDHLGDGIVQALAGRVDRLSCSVESFDSETLRQLDRCGTWGSGVNALDRLAETVGRFPSFGINMVFNFPNQTEELLLRDVETIKRIGPDTATFYPLMSSNLAPADSADDPDSIDFDREASYYHLITSTLAGELEPISAWTFAREPGLAKAEEPADCAEYVGVGSGAVSFIDGALYGNTISLAEYGHRIDHGQMAIVKCSERYNLFARMRYRFVMDLFALRLDKARFREEFGVPVDIALAAEIAFLSAVGGIAKNSAQEITLTDHGRYLVLVMMRETLTSGNDARDQARTPIPLGERARLLRDEDVPKPAK
jgi:coproporphyrinogen III oxidase-like Fe-S oxidoreductase